MYSKEMQWSNWATLVGLMINVSSQGSLASQVEQGKSLYDKWTDLTYGLTDEQVVALPQFVGKTAEDITAMRFVMGGLKALHDVYAAQKPYFVPFE